MITVNELRYIRDMVIELSDSIENHRSKFIHPKEWDEISEQELKETAEKQFAELKQFINSLES